MVQAIVVNKFLEAFSEKCEHKALYRGAEPPCYSLEPLRQMQIPLVSPQLVANILKQLTAGKSISPSWREMDIFVHLETNISHLGISFPLRECSLSQEQ